MARFQTVRISVQEMQERFEEQGLRFPEEIGVRVERVSAELIGPRLRDCFEPGTMSVMISYIDEATGSEVARAHFFELPDGSIGASGTPDPKRLLVGDTLYVVERQAPQGCINTG